MALDLDALDGEVMAFLREYHLASLTTVRPDGRPHVVPVGFSYDPDQRLARVITFAGSTKAKLLATHGDRPAALSQVDGGRWLTLTGTATLTDDPERVAAAVAGYTERYRPPAERADRVAIEVRVDEILGRA
ncbi:MAG: pyridoxamine 5'-phosphate oxidase family protein [Acidimicrobiales bacterium]